MPYHRRRATSVVDVSRVLVSQRQLVQAIIIGCVINNRPSDAASATVLILGGKRAACERTGAG
jgi:hypothetical protein